MGLRSQAAVGRWRTQPSAHIPTVATHTHLTPGRYAPTILVLGVAAFSFLFFYDIDRAKHDAMVEELDRRRTIVREGKKGKTLV